MNPSSHSVLAQDLPGKSHGREGTTHRGPKGHIGGGARQLLALLAMTSVACGGSSPSSPTPVAAATPPPAAAIAATGNGALVLHPSIDARFTFAMETPISVTETGGGTADWNFARISFFLNGREVERGEIGADTIRDAGATRINPRSTNARTLIFRFNSDDFDTISITLGFGDVSTGRQFTVVVDGSTFTDVNLSLTPLLRSTDPR